MRIKQKILYVEDNMANLLLIKKIMANNHNIAMLEAVTAEQGLTIAINKQPELILIDIVLPKMNGYELLDQLKETPHTKNIPAIAISANATTADIAKGRKSAFDEYITKPIDVAEFRKTVNKYLPDVLEFEQ